MICFGIIYGEFMERLGDAASGTAIVNGVFFTVFSFTGNFIHIFLYTVILIYFECIFILFVFLLNLQSILFFF